MGEVKRSVLPIALVLLCAAGCSNAQEPEPTENKSAATASPTYQLADGSCATSMDADRSDASSTAHYYASIGHCWDTQVDENTMAGVLRAKELMSVSWYEQQKEGASARNALQSQFVKAAEHQGYSVPEVNPSGGDVDQDVAADKAVRGVTTSWHWKSRDGVADISGGKDQQIVYLEKHGGQWIVVGAQTTMTEELDNA